MVEPLVLALVVLSYQFCVASLVVRVGLGLTDSISTWFGILVSRSLRSSGPKVVVVVVVVVVVIVVIMIIFIVMIMIIMMTVVTSILGAQSLRCFGGWYVCTVVCYAIL